jgi:ribosomal protein L10
LVKISQEIENFSQIYTNETKISKLLLEKKNASNGFLTVVTLSNFNTKEHRNTRLGVNLTPS